MAEIYSYQGPCSLGRSLCRHCGQSPLTCSCLWGPQKAPALGNHGLHSTPRITESVILAEKMEPTRLLGDAGPSEGLEDSPVPRKHGTAAITVIHCKLHGGGDCASLVHRCLTQGPTGYPHSEKKRWVPGRGNYGIRGKDEDRAF